MLTSSYNMAYSLLGISRFQLRTFLHQVLLHQAFSTRAFPPWAFLHYVSVPCVSALCVSEPCVSVHAEGKSQMHLHEYSPNNLQLLTHRNWSEADAEATPASQANTCSEMHPLGDSSRQPRPTTLMRVVLMQPFQSTINGIHDTAEWYGNAQFGNVRCGNVTMLKHVVQKLD